MNHKDILDRYIYLSISTDCGISNYITLGSLPDTIEGDELNILTWNIWKNPDGVLNNLLYIDLCSLPWNYL